MRDTRRSLPSVDRVLSHPDVRALPWPRDQIANEVRDVMHSRRRVLRCKSQVLTAADLQKELDLIARLVAWRLRLKFSPTLRPVINATGVVIHTNLGRAPLSAAAAEAMRAAAGYANLEFDLDSGTRGSRGQHLDSMLQSLTGAQAALVVNNNAAALYLALSAHAQEREVIVSRGQAVEIGGGFRIPDVLRQSGARLVEVGTTNRTRAADYRAAVSDDSAALLRVHTSNFRVVGFTEETPLAELREIADQHKLLLMDDIGSGCLLETQDYGLTHEPTPRESAAAGADLTMFSGDKLLGGPQAGIIVGRQAAIERLTRHPLMRALRADKTTIAALAATLQHYLLGEAESEVPVWRMIAAKPDTLRERAESWRDQLGEGEVAADQSPIGGGSLPTETRPTYVLRLPNPERADLLRLADPPVVARVVDGWVQVDPRTVLPEQEEPLIAALRDFS